MFRTMQSASACLHRLPYSGGSELGSRLCQPLKLTDGCQTDFSARTQAATPLKAAALNVQRSRKKGEEWFSDRATLINGHPGPPQLSMYPRCQHNFAVIFTLFGEGTTSPFSFLKAFRASRHYYKWHLNTCWDTCPQRSIDGQF